MTEAIRESRSPYRSILPSVWAIVVADDTGLESSSEYPALGADVPAAFQRFGGSATLLQKALRRAARFAPAARQFVTVREEDRSRWDPSLWFVRPAHRLVTQGRGNAGLPTAAGFLRIASEHPSDVVLLLPARCFVVSEQALQAAITRAIKTLPYVTEGVLALGMRDLDVGPDEDYLLPLKEGLGHPPVLGVARQPVSWVAGHLARNGAMVASGILVGYAGVFAAHISRYLPGVTAGLLRASEKAAAEGIEVDIQSPYGRSIPAFAARALRWQAPFLPQRVVCVNHCGWSSLRSARAIARIRETALQDKNPVTTGRTAAGTR
jgi:mannose-1-phosphate guanylyltransferase